MTADDALTPEIVDEEEEFNPVVEGRRITPRQVEVFKLWAKSVPYLEIEEKLGLHFGYVKKAVYGAHWFETLWDRTYGASQLEYFRDVISGDKSLAKNVKAIGAGERKDDKSAMAAVKLHEIRTQLGPRPMLNKRGNINIQNIIGSSVTINQVQLKTMTQEELLEMNESGVIPSRMTEGNG
ncbi:MAG: hypothetical protein IID17_14605 [Nitrospinae bacterium]|nr:hypothetical protein [Nitrospinota bacterium]